MNESEIYQEAVYTFGPRHQIVKCIEEMSELTKELAKDLDGKGVPDHIAEEMGDVEILLSQLKLIYGNAELVKQHKEDKLRYLNNLIFEAKYGT